eukprot:TRINITY_DN23843_c0_g1_i1.p1 TRINITY_DN23843_c0_g1~~TRINITY_DN23843_c0_g1_i1.p1  ORF type:complete len:309 (+),score=41.76 TRINITY_DN23843_c0_g1_i1:35-961(+)
MNNAQSSSNTASSMPGLREILTKFGGINQAEQNAQDSAACTAGGHPSSDAEDGAEKIDLGSLSTGDKASVNSASSSSHSHTGSSGRNTANRPYKHRSYQREAQVIWVHEHCFRPQNEQWRKQLKIVAHNHGADLAYIITALKLPIHLRWPPAAGPPMQLKYYALVTSWREAKPLADLFDPQTTQASMLPRFMVIVCEAGRPHRRALQWVESAVLQFPVYCISEGLAVPGVRVHHPRHHHHSECELKEISDLLSLADEDALPLPSAFHQLRAPATSSSNPSSEVEQSFNQQFQAASEHYKADHRTVISL